MRKIFIDAGAYNGDSILHFKKTVPASDEYEIFAFEANPAYTEQLTKLTPNFFNRVVWIHNESTNFFIGKDPTGSTALKDKKSGQVDYNHPTHIQAIDFSQWIIDTFQPDDYIILKMDIEGAEFVVLPDMFESGAINYVNELWVEMHPNKLPQYTTKDADHLRNKIKELSIIYKDWH